MDTAIYIEFYHNSFGLETYGRIVVCGAVTLLPAVTPPPKDIINVGGFYTYEILLLQ